ncbi:hypothetical protein GCM10010916_43720 [Paenibacillus abyssi]|uniref:Uncharacterized protein n=1 Tax=Paenibacillus abyssi TaxID=1340531 RepID=A0A917G563_9BACL|nr:hypothetical protein GCM10010916_43720 [Paenibacillus abyssi]
MNRWILLRIIGFGALTFFLLRYTVDGHFNLYDIVPAVILVGIATNEYFIRQRKNRTLPKK